MLAACDYQKKRFQLSSGDGITLKKWFPSNCRRVWHYPLARPPPPDGSGPYTYEPCEDVDPTPDHENVLTD